MIVVADTSPLIVLGRLGRMEILRDLFSEVVVPVQVDTEYRAGVNPKKEPDLCLIPWIRVKDSLSELQISGLHAGEVAAIALAKNLSADWLIIDDKAGRKAASREKLRTVGTIGVLEAAAELGLLDLKAAFAELIEIKFHIQPAFLRSRFSEHLERMAKYHGTKNSNLPIMKMRDLSGRFPPLSLTYRFPLEAD